MTWSSLVDRALQGQGGASGIQRVSFGIATTATAMPTEEMTVWDKIDQPVLVHRSPTSRGYKRPKPGKYWVVVQAFDATGRASPPKRQSFIVTEAKSTSPVATAPAKGPPASAVKRIGAIRGKIAASSYLNGSLSIDPAPDGVRPGKKMKVSGTNPSFAFENLPEGEYTVTFKGNVGNQGEKTLAWGDLKIDTAGGKPAYSLSPSDADAGE